MSKFKAGDKVVCVATRMYATIGKEYMVKGVGSNGAVCFIDDDGDENWYDPDTFELVPPPIDFTNIDFTKPLETQDATPVEIVYTNGRDTEYPVAAYIGSNIQPSRFTATGKYFSSGNASVNDLRNVAPKPREAEVYVNVYLSSNKNEIYGSGSYTTREKADNGAGVSRLGCVKVKLVEGQYDE